jgi:hypothetical protein
MVESTPEDVAAEAEKLLRTIIPDAFCVAQEWDNRIDCILKLPDGTSVGEMVRLSELTELRIREAGRRLEQRARGVDVQLVNELRAPRRITPEK